MTKGDYILKIGPKVFNFSVIDNYVGWDTFYEFIAKYTKTLFELEILDSIKRAALRYINFFDFNIYNKSTLSVSLNNNILTDHKSNLKVEISENKTLSVLRMSNNANMNQKSGSVIDIDCIYNSDLSSFSDNYLEIVDELHIEEKKLFFSLLQKDYLETLNPIY
ncbi:MAG: TIGR04255 family protein [Desulfovermiculus sp.]|nr:TIGR04255 family protein [Desulfovermiculus sp.]